MYQHNGYDIDTDIDTNGHDIDTHVSGALQNATVFPEPQMPGVCAHA
jgi:hypothetical protein